MEIEIVTIVVTEYETTDLQTDMPNEPTTIKPEDSVFTPRVIMGITLASAVGLLLLGAMVIFIMSMRNRRRAYSNRDDGPVNLSTNDDIQYNSAPKPGVHAWAYSNNAIDAMGDEGIEADLDPKTENRMKHLAATFETAASLGPFKPGKKRANFDRDSFYADHETDDSDAAPIYGNINVGQAEERRHSTCTFFSGDLPTTPL